MSKPAKSLTRRISKLKQHLRRENPILVDVVKHYEQLDKLGYKTGLLDHDESFTNSITWWPLVSVLGTFSAGKSTFINNFLGIKLQSTGNQAVDDKFTVIAYANEDEPRVLPGLALDADPRFPFYQISEEIEKVAEGEGGRIDTYLQLKTCKSDRLNDLIMIDSPGFDADDQRDAILKITHHIVDLSDLVLVFFDARHPEPKAMRDTLEHLVKEAMVRIDANKFVFVLNQIDTTAAEDNLDDVVAAWQKSIVSTGMTAGTFYRHYNPSAAVNIDDETVQQRFEAIREDDFEEITSRVSKLGVERAYRIVGALENTANLIETQWMPTVIESIRSWRKSVLMTDATLFGVIAIALAADGLTMGWFSGLSLDVLASDSGSSFIGLGIGAAVVAVLLIWLHFLARKLHGKRIIRKLEKAGEDSRVIKVFKKNIRFPRTVLTSRPAGWGAMTTKRLVLVREAADKFVQTLNDKYTDFNGSK